MYNIVFQMYSTVVYLNMHIYPFFFRFISHLVNTEY